MPIEISPLISPDLLSVLYRMGYGDEIVLSDAHFPGESLGPQVVRADGLRVASLLEAILPLFALDSYVDSPPIMMSALPSDTLDPQVEASDRAAADRHWPQTPAIARLERVAFHERSKRASAIVIAGETAKYGNTILKKGVTPVPLS